MNTTNITLIALLFLLLNSETITTTQFLLLLALLSTAGAICPRLCQGGDEIRPRTTTTTIS